MTNEKIRVPWHQLTAYFTANKKILRLISLPKGYETVFIYLYLICKCTESRNKTGEILPDTGSGSPVSKSIAMETGISEDIVINAFSELQKRKMIRVENDTVFIDSYAEYNGDCGKNWIALPADFYRKAKIIYLRGIEKTGFQLIFIYLSMLCRCKLEDDSGILKVPEGDLFWTKEVFAAIFGCSEEVAETAMKEFEYAELITVNEDTITINDWERYYKPSASERVKQSAERKQISKAKNKKRLIGERNGRVYKYPEESVSEISA